MNQSNAAQLTEGQAVIDANKLLKEKMDRDPHRPVYHFLPATNWMNDPNGACQWNGEYHIFYQYNPNGGFWGTMHWGHASSQDLIHWTDLPVALAPDPGTVDEYGVFSGCMAINNGVPTIVYTGVRMNPETGKRVQLPCIATSQDNMRTWQKHPGNPVIATPPEGLDVTGFRDHAVWQEDGYWYMVVGSGVTDEGGAIFLYRSKDLINWEYMNPLFRGTVEETGVMWECPDFFPLGNKYVLIMSILPTKDTIYYIGSYDREKHVFIPEQKGILDGGGIYYAPQSFLDEQGRRIIWGWLQEGRSVPTHTEAGWAGVMSAPRILFLHPDGSLGVKPVPELEALRSEHRQLEQAIQTTGNPADVPLFNSPVSGNWELSLQVDPRKAAQFGLRLNYSEGEETVIRYNTETGRLEIDRTASSHNTSDQHDVRGEACKLDDNGQLNLRVFLDRSEIEIYANDRIGLSSRIYPTDPTSLSLSVFSVGGSATVLKGEFWEMESCWKGPREFWTQQ
ncbi:MAG: glycoside hydrolase family 32 protein [Chloroflexi bacterium]|nr:glycoside hydrolase family 32 protein [Chloroflexota bacterium]